MRKLALLVRSSVTPARLCFALLGAVLWFSCRGAIGERGERSPARSEGAQGTGGEGAASGAGRTSGGNAGAGAIANAGASGGEEGAPLRAGAWTAVTQTYPANGSEGSPAAPGTAQLLTDGRVLASGPLASTAWYTFAPDAYGSYQHGTWAPAASTPIGRVYHPGFILPDGRYWAGGGEYMNGTTTRAEDEVYDPAKDTWTVLPDMPEEIADTPAAILGDGRVLVLSHLWTSNSTYMLSFDPVPTWSLAAPWTTAIGDQESSSLLLQDGSMLAGSRLFQIYLPQSNAWIDAAVPPGGPGVFVPARSDEMGPFLMLHDGRILVLGATKKNGIFTPGGPSGAGSWTTAADTPEPFNHGDAPSIVEPDGKVLTVGTNDETGEGFAAGVFYEYDPTADAWSLVSTPFTFTNAEAVTLLALPNGQIWVSGPGNSRAWLYTPAGAPQIEWKPIITGVSAPTIGQLLLTGTRLNGTTAGGDDGDDNKMATNFPVVSFTDGAGRVFYGRSFDLDTMIPGACASASVVPPTSLPDGTYDVDVAASGVHEDVPLQVTFSGPRVASIVAPTSSQPGQPTSGTVRLTAPAPSGGTQVQLLASDPRVAGVPSSVLVPEGEVLASFDIDAPAIVGRATIRAATTNNPALAASTVFGWSVASVTGPSVTPSGTTATWAVTLDNAAPADGAVVTLTSTNPALVTVPQSVTVPAGHKRATFTATLADPLAGSGRIYATLPGSAASAFFGWYVSGLSGPMSAAQGTAPPWTVSLSEPAPAGGVVVGLLSRDTPVATVPLSVTVPAGQTSAMFPVSALEDPLSGTTTLTAAVNASFVAPAFQYALTATVSPTTIAVGGVATATLTVTPAAPAGGFTIALQSSHPSAATVPRTATIAANATSTTFPVTGVAPGPSAIVMTLGGWSQTMTILVDGP